MSVFNFIFDRFDIRGQDLDGTQLVYVNILNCDVMECFDKTLEIIITSVNCFPLHGTDRRHDQSGPMD